MHDGYSHLPSVYNMLEPQRFCVALPTPLLPILPSLWQHDLFPSPEIRVRNTIYSRGHAGLSLLCLVYFTERNDIQV